MSKKLSQFEPFEGQKLMIELQQRGVALNGGPDIDGLVAVVIGLCNHLVSTKILKDPE